MDKKLNLMKMLITILIFIMMFGLFSCKNVDNDIIFEDKLFKVIKLEKNKEEIFTHIDSEWLEISEDELYVNEGDIIIKGYIEKITDIKQEYYINDSYLENYALLCDFNISTIYSNKLNDSKSELIKENNTIKIIMPHSTYFLMDGLCEVNIGDEFIFFAMSTEKIDKMYDSPIKFSTYADYAVRNPQSMLKKVND